MRNVIYQQIFASINWASPLRKWTLAPQVLLSGGVDSTVCTALLNKALKQDQVIALHIDNGFMRKKESQCVEEALRKLGIKVKGKNQNGLDWFKWIMLSICSDLWKYLSRNLWICVVNCVVQVQTRMMSMKVNPSPEESFEMVTPFPLKQRRLRRGVHG